LRSGAGSAFHVVLSYCLNPITSPISLADNQSYRLQ